MNVRSILQMPDDFCIVSDHAKLKLVSTDKMSVQQQIVIICPVTCTVQVNERTIQFMREGLSE